MRNTTGDDGLPRVPRRSGEAGLYRVPRLEELVADPGATGMLDARTADFLEATALAALRALRKRKQMLASEMRAEALVRRPDRLLTPKEAAGRLGIGVYWVYRNQHKLPFRVRLGTVPRFSEKGLEEYIRKQRGG